MPSHIFNPTTVAFNVDRVRAAMLEGVRLPEGFLQKAIDTAFAKLDAKRTQFFSKDGMVVDERTVEDNQTQLAAADRILTMAGVYARDREAQPSAPAVALEMDPRTGVVRLVVGIVDSLPSIPLQNDDASVVPQALKALAPLQEEACLPEALMEQPEVIHVNRGNLSPVVFKALFGDGRS